jgi:hypothetical protein
LPEAMILVNLAFHGIYKIHRFKWWRRSESNPLHVRDFPVGKSRVGAGDALNVKQGAWIVKGIKNGCFTPALKKSFPLLCDPPKMAGIEMVR